MTYEVTVQKVGGIAYGESGIQTLEEARRIRGTMICALAVENYSIVSETKQEITLRKNKHNMITISIKESQDD